MKNETPSITMTSSNVDFIFPCSLYPNHTDTTVSVHGLYNWLINVKNGTYRSRVEEARKLYEKKEDQKVTAIEKELPAFIPTGFMPDGRNEDDPIHLNRVCCIDITTQDKKESEQIKMKLTGRPGVIGAYLTLRYNLRFFIYMPSFTNPYNFSFIQQVIVESLEKQLEVKLDENTSSTHRLCSCSYDPDAYIVPFEELQEFPYAEAMASIRDEVFKELDSIEENKDTAPSRPLSESEKILHKLQGQRQSPLTDEQMENLFQCITDRYPLTPGHRHENLKHIGEFSYLMRYNSSEMDYLINNCVTFINDNEYNLEEVSTHICWGYAHHENPAGMTELANQKLMEIVKVQAEVMAQSQREEEKKAVKRAIYDANYQKLFSEEISISCPYFSKFVYDHIPRIIRGLIKEDGTRREKDANLASLLNAISAVLPNVDVISRKKVYSTHFSFLCIGASFPGENIVDKGITVLDGLQGRIDLTNNLHRKLNELQELQWKKELELALEENRKADYSRKPEKGKTNNALVLDASESKKGFYAKLAYNENGMLLVAPQLSTMVEHIKTDTDHYLSVLNKASLNQEIDYDRDDPEKAILINRPKLALSAQGTLSQYAEFVGNTHKGLEVSTMCLLMSQDEEQFNLVHPTQEGKFPPDPSYKELSDELVNIYDFLKNSPTLVYLPRGENEMCEHTFRRYQRQLTEEGHDCLGDIVRYGSIMVARLCGIMAALRKYDTRLPVREIKATDTEVYTALEITKVFLRHTCMAATLVMDNPHKLEKVNDLFKSETFYELLPPIFTTGDVKEMSAHTYEWTEGQIKRMLRTWTDENYLDKIRTGYYKKTDRGLYDSVEHQ